MNGNLKWVSIFFVLFCYFLLFDPCADRLLTQVSLSMFLDMFSLIQFTVMFSFDNSTLKWFPFVSKAGFVDTLYSWSAFNTEEIGNVIAESLKHLIKSYPIENIHLIGELKTKNCKQCNCFRLSVAKRKKERRFFFIRDFKQLLDFLFYFLIFLFSVV